MKNWFYLLLAAATGGVLYYGSGPASAATKPGNGKPANGNGKIPTPKITLELLSSGQDARKVGDVIAIKPEVHQATSFNWSESEPGVATPLGSGVFRAGEMAYLQIKKPGTLQFSWQIPAGDGMVTLRNIGISATA